MFLSACGTPADDTSKVIISTAKKNTIIIQPISSVGINEAEEPTVFDYATYFIVIADTSIQYYYLHKKMFALMLH